MTPSELSALREELRTQDNRFTADPLFVVFEEHRVYGVGPEYTDDFEWFQADDHFRLPPTLMKSKSLRG